MKNKNQKNDLLNTAVKWRLIGLLFECPGDGWTDEITALSAESGDATLMLAAENARIEASEGLYHSIFGPGGPAPPREVTYRSWVQPGFLLAELSAFYKAFAYDPKTPDVPDHIAVEAGFVAYLKLKEAFALEGGDNEHAEITAAAAEKFVAEHIAKFAERLSELLQNSRVEYLVLAGKALFEAAGKDPDAGRKVLPVLAEIDEESFTCGTGEMPQGSFAEM